MICHEIRGETEENNVWNCGSSLGKYDGFCVIKSEDSRLWTLDVILMRHHFSTLWIENLSLGSTQTALVGRGLEGEALNWILWQKAGTDASRVYFKNVC